MRWSLQALIFVGLLVFGGEPHRMAQAGQPGEAYPALTDDGAWCWFSDPRAIQHGGRVFAGWASKDGSVVVGAVDGETGAVETSILHEKLSRDDHISPSLLVLPDGRLAVFYSKHSADALMRLRVSSEPGSITSFEPERTFTLNDQKAADNPDWKGNICYSNPALLSQRDDRLFLFWRGLGSKPTLAISDDLGQSFGTSRPIVWPATTYGGQRPYLKMDSDGQGRILLAFTDGHPRNEPTNSIYFASFDGERFRKADGTEFSTLESAPFDSRKADLVYDGRPEEIRAWVWDVAADQEGKPVIVYTRLPAENDHRYHYAAWDGSRWVDHEIAGGGITWFPQTPADKKEPEPHYSPGLVLDHNQPGTVYLSVPRNGRLEIERWTTADLGQSWSKEAITSGSSQDNIRPVAVRHSSRDGKGPRVIWMSVKRYVHYTDYDCSLRMDWQGAESP